MFKAADPWTRSIKCIMIRNRSWLACWLQHNKQMLDVDGYDSLNHVLLCEEWKTVVVLVNLELRIKKLIRASAGLAAAAD